MIDGQRSALESVQFNWAPTPEDVWSRVTYHVTGLHERVARDLLRAVPAKAGPAGASPVGVVLEGERGVGKTHLLRWLREQVQGGGGSFFLLKFFEGNDFWRSAVHGIVDSFEAGEVDQLKEFLTRLGRLAGLTQEQLLRITGMLAVSRGDLDALVAGLRKIDGQVWSDCQNTLRALVLFRALSQDVQNVGDDYLRLDGDVEEGAREAWGFRRGARPHQLILRDLSRLFALTGPIVIAVDQIDQLITQSSSVLRDAGKNEDKHSALVSELADGLMELREYTRRTLSVVACLPASWGMLTRSATNSAADRFRVRTLQGAMPDGAVAEQIVAQHLGDWYGEAGYDPPYPTWPILSSAFTGTTVRTFTPRRLLQRVDEHIKECLEAGQVCELADLVDRPLPVGESTPPDERVLSELDDWFAQLRSEADVSGPLDQDSEDELMPPLLAAGLSAYVIELGADGQGIVVDRVRGRRPAVHARLRQTIDEATEDEVHVAFRAVAHSNARAVQSRIATARTSAGLGAGDRRRLVLLRNRDWPTGRVTSATVAEFEALGGTAIPISDSDLRMLGALLVMQRQQRPGYPEWLVSRRPAGSSELFRRTLPGGMSVTLPPVGGPHEPLLEGRESAEGSTVSDTESPSDQQEGQRPPPRPRPTPYPRARSVPVGRIEKEQRDLLVPLASLRKHTVVFAGSGSGKTVLLRRLIEECALHGVSAIVLDSNNDLSRLGDPWPEPPASWFDGDEAKAADYLARTEVVVWTPGRSRGRPLSFQPLPDFAAVLDEEDEFRMAVDSAVASLIPRAGLSGRKVEQGAAVLREALRYFARNGGTTLPSFVDLIDELPEGISTLRTGAKLGTEMAEALRAAIINDPLFGGAGQPVDPAALLAPSTGKRARVSVISFIGLPSNEQRQSFVNQLQMALFSWIKANPAADRPLGGLLVMDEAQNYAPAGAFTACTQSTVALASQARKYGLGLVFATQGPKGINHNISGNAATQFFGVLNSVAHIEAAKDMARAKGGRVDDIAQLTAGEFFAAGEGMAFERVREPMCLSHHPQSPPTEEEVLARAAEG